MSSNIFAETAPSYFARKISVIPLRRQHKAPTPNGWQVFCSTVAEPDTQNAWLERYADGNIGLPLGPANQLVAIDLDADDPKITELIESLLPTTPWVRRGKKGAVYMFKSPPSAEHRTFRIKDIDGKSLVECLAKGTQIVLPPSIHPETLRPYTATCDLWTVKRDIYEGKKSLPAGWDEGLSEDERTAAAKGFGEDSEEWTPERCIEYLDAQFELHDRGSTGRRKVIDEVLLRISKSASMTKLDEEAVLGHIYACSGKTITMSAMRKRLNELKKGDVEGADHTEIANALIKELSRRGETRVEGDRLHQWAGSHWIEIDDEFAMATVALEFGSMMAARRNSDHKGVLDITKRLVPKGLKSSPLVGINFANGYLTADLVLRPHSPDHGCTYVLSYCYDASLSTAPQRFLSFLYQSWGEDSDYADKVQALREAIAATMFQQAWKFQRAFCLHGVPESGKSVLKGIVEVRG